MSELYESDQAALVRRFSHDVLEAVESPDESQDFSQLRADLIEDVKKRSEETHAKIKAIEDQFRATGSVPASISGAMNFNLVFSFLVRM